MELTMNNTMNTDEDYLLLEVTENGLRLLLVGMAPLGLAANTLACLVASRLKNQTSGTTFMKQLAAADFLAVAGTLIQGVGNAWLQSVSWIGNNYFCRSVRFLNGSSINAGITLPLYLNIQYYTLYLFTYCYDYLTECYFG